MTGTRTRWIRKGTRETFEELYAVTPRMPNDLFSLPFLWLVNEGWGLGAVVVFSFPFSFRMAGFCGKVTMYISE